MENLKEGNKKSEAFIRVDDRLVHGQIVNYWCTYYHSKDVIVVDQSTLNNSIKKMFFEMALPRDFSLKILDVDLFMNYFNELKDTGIEANMLIIDNIGMLSSLYKYATICIIGGGWVKEGIHNILEAAVFYKPVVFGPVYNKYFEAKEIIEEGGGYSVDNLFQLKDLLHKLNIDQGFYKETAEKAGKFVLNRAGATPKIINKIETLSYPHK